MKKYFLMSSAAVVIGTLRISIHLHSLSENVKRETTFYSICFSDESLCKGATLKGKNLMLLVVYL